MITRAACVPPLLLLLVTACSANRPPVTTSLPAPLVTALLNDRGTVRPSPEYAVRSLPLRFPSALVPSGPVTVVGGMTNGDEIVAVFSDSTRRLAAVFEQLFNQAGFVRPAPSPGSGFSPGLGPYTYFCRDSATVTAEPLTGANRNLVRVTYRVQRGPRTCPTVQRGPAAGANELHLPELTPPPGVLAGSSRGSGGGDAQSSSAELTGTAMVPSAILAHYAAQLSAAGWTGSPPAISEHLAAQLFDAKDASGRAWEGVLMATGNGTEITASLSMHLRGNP